MNKKEVTVKLNPLFIALAMLLIVFILSLMHIFQLIIYFKVGDPEVFDFIKMVDFDYEGNLPSLYSSMAILYCSVLLLIIAIKTRRELVIGQYHWLCLCFIFLFLGIDEGVGLHEEIGDLVEKFIKTSGYFYFTWIIPYGIALVFFGISYIRFLFILPKKTAIQFIIAGVLFITGALGIESISANEADINGTGTIFYSVLCTIEEIFEMIGIIIFAYALMEYIAEYIGVWSIEFVQKPSNKQ